jgi:hypothetical protein
MDLENGITVGDDEDGMRGPPVGNDNFRKLRDRDSYYVDKTGLIREIVHRSDIDVFLFTRPRRFGKSLNMSMLDAFFNVDYEGNSWFEGLEVMDDPDCLALMNRYPVISVSLKNLMTDSFENFIGSFKMEMLWLFSKFRYLLKTDLDPSLLEIFDEIGNKTANMTTLIGCIRTLSMLLNLHFGKKTIVIIDEYDNPTQSSYGKPTQDEILSFMRGLMTSTLKGNDSLEFGVVTGVVQIAKESLFSGLNNLYVDNILSERFGEYFGFTENEVRDMLSFYGRPDRFPECKEWYDGYTFGNSRIYNPWSVLNYVAYDFVPEPYWIGSGSSGSVREMIRNADDQLNAVLRRLGSGEEVHATMDSRIVYADLDGDLDRTLTVLAMAGYLTARKGKEGRLVRIPNREMFEAFLRLMSVGGDSEIPRKILSLAGALKSGDADGIGRLMSDLFKSALSAKVLDREHSYQAFLTGLLMGFCGGYEISADRIESGKGFADIILKRRRRNAGPNVIIELKKSASENS